METRQHLQLTESRAADATRRVVLRSLGGAGLAAGLLLGTHRGVLASDADVTARMAMGALNQALAIGDDSRLDNDFAPDVVVHPRHRIVATGVEVPAGLAGLKAALADVRGIATDIQLIVDEFVAENDEVAGRVTVRCTPVGSSGRIETSALVFMAISDGRVREMWFYLDPSAMMSFVSSLSEDASRLSA